MVFDLLLFFRVNEPSTGVEDAQIVRILNVSLVKVEGYSVLLSGKVQGIEGFSLSFRDGRNVRRSGKSPVPGEASSCVLDDQALWLVAF